jgi:hypothetical protein
MSKPVTVSKLTPEGIKFFEAVQQFQKKPYVKAGVLKLDAKQPKVLDEEGNQSATVHLIDVAIANEFGTKHIPERSYLRATIRKQSGKWADMGKKLIVRCFHGEISTEDALGIMGLQIVKDVQATMRGNVPPPNAPSTIRRKTATIQGKKARLHADIRGAFGEGTLRDTGQLLNSMSSQVIMGDGK